MDSRGKQSASARRSSKTANKRSGTLPPAEKRAIREPFSATPRIARKLRAMLGGLDEHPQHALAAPVRPCTKLSSPSDLGELVRSARKDMKLSQQHFADLAGVGRRFISELEAGKPTLELGKALEVCSAAGIDVLARRR
jgi:y4mF family transcriptional regulator